MTAHTESALTPVASSKTNPSEGQAPSGSVASENLKTMAATAVVNGAEAIGTTKVNEDELEIEQSQLMNQGTQMQEQLINEQAQLQAKYPYLSQRAAQAGGYD